MIRFLDACRADLEHYRRKTTAQWKSWKRRDVALGKTLHLLDAHKVERVAELPPHAIAQLKGIVQEGWRGDG